MYHQSNYFMRLNELCDKRSFEILRAESARIFQAGITGRDSPFFQFLLSEIDSFPLKESKIAVLPELRGDVLVVHVAGFFDQQSENVHVRLFDYFHHLRPDAISHIIVEAGGRRTFIIEPAHLTYIIGGGRLRPMVINPSPGCRVILECLGFKTIASATVEEALQLVRQNA